MRSSLSWSPLVLLVCAGCAADTFGGGDAAIDGGSDSATADAGGGCSACGPTDLCCIYTGTTTTYACAPTCAPPTNGQDLSALACKSTADCVAMVCCMSRSNNVTQSACQLQCDTSQQAQLCDPSSPDAGCPVGTPCSTDHIADWKLPQSFGTCGGVTIP